MPVYFYETGNLTEKALQSIKSKLHISLSRVETTALVLLDLLATFNTIPLFLGVFRRGFQFDMCSQMNGKNKNTKFHFFAVNAHFYMPFEECLFWL